MLLASYTPIYTKSEVSQWSIFYLVSYIRKPIHTKPEVRKSSIFYLGPTVQEATFNETPMLKST